ncbi:MAG: hypothetical protein AUJ07_01520 [Crenarchaeota archaeon 13_1_40CM_3_53_5]|nr:MAG: hypothetical protein AUJ07_01520 [Crenarchaeota archaeon 13_1_40CM_3_53_5]
MKISESAAKANTLVVLPTGLGKTVIALLVAIRRLSSNMNSKILLLAPTKPLVVQHAKFFGDHLEGSLVEAILTGEVSAEERAKLLLGMTFASTSTLCEKCAWWFLTRLTDAFETMRILKLQRHTSLKHITR